MPGLHEATLISNGAQDHTYQVVSSVADGPLQPPIRCVVYNGTSHPSCSKRGALVDRGANGGIVGCDARVLFQYETPGVDVCGIDNHKLNNLKLVDAAAKTTSNKGPVIVTFRQCAYHGFNAPSSHRHKLSIVITMLMIDL